MYTDGRLPQASFEGLAVNTLVSLSGKQAFSPISLEAETFITFWNTVVPLEP